MKINIQALLKLIAKEEKNLDYLLVNLRSHLFNISIEELDGRCKIIEDYKCEFEEELIELDKLIKRIIDYKNILFEKNNAFKLSDGRTLHQAIIDNLYLKKHRQFFENIVRNKSTKKRVSSSYFECYDLNFDVKIMKRRLKEINEKIEVTENEIAKLNLIDFTI